MLLHCVNSQFLGFFLDMANATKEVVNGTLSAIITTAIPTRDRRGLRDTLSAYLEFFPAPFLNSPRAFFEIADSLKELIVDFA